MISTKKSWFHEPRLHARRITGQPNAKALAERTCPVLFPRGPYSSMKRVTSGSSHAQIPVRCVRRSCQPGRHRCAHARQGERQKSAKVKPVLLNLEKPPLFNMSSTDVPRPFDIIEVLFEVDQGDMYWWPVEIVESEEIENSSLVRGYGADRVLRP